MSNSSTSSCSWQNIATIDRWIDRSIMAPLQLQKNIRPSQKYWNFHILTLWTFDLATTDADDKVKSRLSGNISSFWEKVLGYYALGEKHWQNSTEIGNKLCTNQLLKSNQNKTILSSPVLLCKQSKHSLLCDFQFTPTESNEFGSAPVQRVPAPISSLLSHPLFSRV
jgi:hypothetical protein